MPPSDMDPPKRNGGQKPKLNKALTEKLCKLVSSGIPKTTAAGTVGIHSITLYQWQQKGRAHLEKGEQSRYSNFVEQLYQAESIARATIFAQWQQCSRYNRGSPTVIQIDEKGKQKVLEKGVPSGPEGDWRSYREMLRCMDPDNWAERVKTELTGKDGGPVRVEKTSPAALAAEARKLIAETFRSGDSTQQTENTDSEPEDPDEGEK